MMKKLIFALLVLIAVAAMPVVATAPFYESKYAAPVIETPAMTGMIYIGTACNTNLFSKEFTITRVTNPKNIQFTNGRVVDKQYADLFPAVNASPFEGELYGTGYWSTTDWAPGIFVVTLLDGNAGDPEYAVYETVAGQTTTIMFQGHAAYIPVVTLAPACSPIYTIEKAEYGKPEHQSCNPVTDYSVRGHWDSEDHFVCDHYHGWSCQYGHTEIVYEWDHSSHWSAWTTTQPERYDQIPNNDKQTRTNQNCVNSGGMVDVTSNVQNAVSQGYSSFVFSNGWEGKYYGGIYNNDIDKLLLSEIEDPVEDVIKDVTITYNNGCGTDKTIQTLEYCTINLASGSATCPVHSTPS